MQTTEPLIHLLHEAPHATLATHSVRQPGYPYATAVPLVLDERHRPLLLISALAEHTKNLLADPRVSLSVVESPAIDIQAAARLTLVGDAERFSPDEALIGRYLRYVPAAEAYLALDFMFFRILPRGVRYIAGLGKMGWVEPAAWPPVPVFAPAEEAELLKRLGRETAPGVGLLGIDCGGIDYEVEGLRKRLRFPAGALRPGQIARGAAQWVAGLGDQGRLSAKSG